MTGYVYNFYLETLLEKFQCMRILIELIPQEFIDLYHLEDKVKNSFVYCDITHDMNGLSEAGILANKPP